MPRLRGEYAISSTKSKHRRHLDLVRDAGACGAVDASAELDGTRMADIGLGTSMLEIEIGEEVEGSANADPVVATQIGETARDSRFGRTATTHCDKSPQGYNGGARAHVHVSERRRGSGLTCPRQRAIQDCTLVRSTAGFLDANRPLAVSRRCSVRLTQTLLCVCVHVLTVSTHTRAHGETAKGTARMRNHTDRTDELRLPPINSKPLHAIGVIRVLAVAAAGCGWGKQQLQANAALFGPEQTDQSAVLALVKKGCASANGRGRSHSHTCIDLARSAAGGSTALEYESHSAPFRNARQGVHVKHSLSAYVPL